MHVRTKQAMQRHVKDQHPRVCHNCQPPLAFRDAHLHFDPRNEVTHRQDDFVDNQTFECPLCPEHYFASQRHVNDHICESHPDLCERCQEDPGARKGQHSRNCWPCPYCTINCSPFSAYCEHLLGHNYFMCFKCEQTFETAGEYETHMDSYKEYECDKCKRRFARENMKDRHQAQCTGSAYKCPTCETGFRFEYALKDHVREKHDELDCPFCGDSEGALAPRELESHIRRNHQCHACGTRCSKADMAFHVCLRGERVSVPLDDKHEVTMFRRMEEHKEKMDYEIKNNIVRGYVCCGRCGWAKWNPKDNDILRNMRRFPGSGFATMEQAQKALPIRRIYRGLNYKEVLLISTASGGGRITHYSSWSNCCSQEKWKDDERFIRALAVGPQDEDRKAQGLQPLDSFDFPECAKRLPEYQRDYLNLGRFQEGSMKKVQFKGGESKKKQGAYESFIGLPKPMHYCAGRMGPLTFVMSPGNMPEEDEAAQFADLPAGSSDEEDFADMPKGSDDEKEGDRTEAERNAEAEWEGNKKNYYKKFKSRTLR